MLEGVHAVRKTTKKTEDPSIIGMVLEGALVAMKGWFDTARLSVERAVTEAVFRVVRQVFVLFLAILGIGFLLSGLARMLSYLFQIPGVGESIVGFMALVVAFILAFFTQEQK